MISTKILIIFLTLIIISFVNSQNLYSITTNDSNDNVLYIIDYVNGGKILFNQIIQLNNTSELVIKGISKVDTIASVITLFCVTNNTFEYAYFIDYNYKSGEQVPSVGVKSESFFGKNSTDYLIYNKESSQIYLPAVVEGDSSGQYNLGVFAWDFSNTTGGHITPYQILNDIDSSFTPMGTFDFNNNLVVLYKSVTNTVQNSLSIVILNVNGTGSEGNNLPIVKKLEITTMSVIYDDFKIYTDNQGKIYIITTFGYTHKYTFVCELLDTDFCGEIFIEEPQQIPANFNFDKYIISANSQNITSFRSLLGDDNQYTLEVGVFPLDFNGGILYTIPNYWSSLSSSNSYTYFAIDSQN